MLNLGVWPRGGQTWNPDPESMEEQGSRDYAEGMPSSPEDVCWKWSHLCIQYLKSQLHVADTVQDIGATRIKDTLCLVLSHSLSSL